VCCPTGPTPAPFVVTPFYVWAAAPLHHRGLDGHQRNAILRTVHGRELIEPINSEKSSGNTKQPWGRDFRPLRQEDESALNGKREGERARPLPAR
jgi:hypothetical protein